ncbi:MAG: dTDP-glucose 4,6-dehydratase [Ignavibacteria bacterium]|nr:dTDP-glucose 4,6-dehydratase [Ignavibacteria bacterium]
MRIFKNLLITGGSGFIGANFIHYLFEKTDFSGNIINVDCLTYAGNPNNLTEIAEKHGNTRYFFFKENVQNYEAIEKIFTQFEIDCLIHFAAESHVDRSIFGPKDFIETNIVGTFNLLEIARKVWGSREDVLFHHISTDEVYGSLGETGFFYENTAYDPRSPYSSSKAASDHLVSAYFHTYKLPVTISNCSNNYGAYQFPEKLIPLMILNILEGKPLPIYGDGKYIRDWLFVDDHCSAIWETVKRGKTGETYNVGGENEWENIKLVNYLCERVAFFTEKDPNEVKKLITYVKDRPGHDRRYAINCDKIKNELNWRQSLDFETGLDETIKWYLNNKEWIENVRSGDYLKWIDKNYTER